MTRGELTSHTITQQYLERIASLDRQARRCDMCSRPTPTPSPSRVHWTPSGKRADAWSDARHSGAREGQHRYRRSHDDDGGLTRARRFEAVARRAHRRTASRGGRRHPRQDEPERVGKLPIDRIRRAAGRDAEDRAAIPMRSTATPSDPAPDRRGAVASSYCAVASAPKPMDRSRPCRCMLARRTQSRRSDW
jgi:hypothetical protein